MVLRLRRDVGRFRLTPDAPSSEGFTLIELLVVVVMVGLLAAIALPSFLSQANRTKQAKALKYIGMINRAQQAYFLEHDHFAPTIETLGFEGQNIDANYTYVIDPGTPEVMTSAKANPTNPGLRGYAGVVFTTLDPGGIARLSTLICEGDPEAVPAPTPTITGAGEVQIVDCDTL
jgi:type IV pilus assembly protein PilA